MAPKKPVWIPKHQIADDLGISVNTLQVFVLNITKRGKLKRPKEGIDTLKQGKQRFYSPEFVDLIKKTRLEETPIGRPKGQGKGKRKKVLAVTVEITDPDEIEVLKLKFKDVAGYLREHLREICARDVERIKKLREKSEQELQRQIDEIIKKV